MALLCSALAALPDHLRTKLCFPSVSFGCSFFPFCLEKKVPLPFLKNTFWTPWMKRLVFLCVFFLCDKQAGHLPVIYLLGFLQVKTQNAGIFNSYWESAQRRFILHWLKAHWKHAFDIRVTYGVVHTTAGATQRQVTLRSSTCSLQYQKAHREWAVSIINTITAECR